MTLSGTPRTIPLSPIIALLYYRADPCRAGYRVSAAIPAPARPLHQRTPGWRFYGAKPSLEPGEIPRYVLQVTAAGSERGTA